MTNPMIPVGPAKVPKTLGRYEVRAKIGEGGMATVYVGRARDGDGERVVALKVIRDSFSRNTQFVDMFIDEAGIVAKLSHPNVVTVHELGDDGGRLFIAMELLFGQSLWEVWETARAKGERIPFGLLAWIGARIARGLHHAHESTDDEGHLQQLVHRDVNPSNVFLTYGGEVKIIDFGLAKARNRVSKTAAGIVKGKLGYLAPEQAQGLPIDRRADLFALGTTLWELSTDQRLFRVKDDFDTLKRILAAAVPDPTTLVPGYPPELWAILRRALERDRDQRYPTAEAMANDLDAYAASAGDSASTAACVRLMGQLFVKEREHQEQWLLEASGTSPAPKMTLKPPPKERIDSVPPPPEAVATPVELPASRSALVSQVAGNVAGQGRAKNLWAGVMFAVLVALAAFFALRN